MAQKLPAPQYVRDQFIGFTGGVNSGLAPSLLPPDQLASSVNGTVRGGYFTGRPAFNKIPIDFQGSTSLQTRFEQGRFQGADYYLSDSGKGLLIGVIGGRVFRLDVTDSDAVCQEVTPSFNVTLTNTFSVPAVGAVVTIIVSSTLNMSANAQIVIGTANYVIVSVNSATSITVSNVDDTASSRTAGSIIQYFDLNPAGIPTAWTQQAENYLIINDGQSRPIIFDGASCIRSNPNGSPPMISTGKQMAYWLGRLWWANPDGLTFRAGDLVYSNGNRSGVLFQKDNTFLASGGNFSVPSNAGEITGMLPVAVLDQSLGQGPLQIATRKMMFSCTASTDSNTWQNTNNPILGVSAIDNGPLSQWSMVSRNSDMFYRAVDGIRSLILARRDFQFWGNVPVSQEMNAILNLDNQAFLDHASAIVFDNRLLHTSGPIPSDRGTYHRGVIALDFDVISSMRNKLPPVYDGLWTGMRPLKLIKGPFGNRERAFAFSQTTAGTIELWEILPTGHGTRDNGITAVTQGFETADIFKQSGIGAGKKIRLTDGEIFIDEVSGVTSFKVWFRPDQSSCWIPWSNFTVCATECVKPSNPYECFEGPFPQPEYRNRIGFGQPTDQCNEDTNSPFREGYTFQVKAQITGTARVKALRFKGHVVDEPENAPKECQDDCYIPVVYNSYEQSIWCDNGLEVLVNNSAVLPPGYSISEGKLIVGVGAYTSSISATDATQIAYKAMKAFWDASIASGALVCQGARWTYSGDFFVAPYLDVIVLSDGSNAPPGIVPGDYSLSFEPVLPVSNPTCGVDPINLYKCSGLGVATNFGPYSADRHITITGHYNLQLFAESSECGFSGLDMIITATQLGSGGSSIIVEQHLLSPDNLTASGSFTMSGVLAAGQTLNLSASVTVSDESPIAVVNPPIISIIVDSITAF